MSWYGFAPYVPVHRRRANAAAFAARLAKKENRKRKDSERRGYETDERLKDFQVSSFHVDGNLRSGHAARPI